jgi:orotidine-5'-phosphate decarboxylase
MGLNGNFVGMVTQPVKLLKMHGIVTKMILIGIFMVIGRPIRDAKDQVHAAEKVAEEIENSLP